MAAGTRHETDILGLFRRSGALLEGHFRLSSGLHSSGYLQCALVLQRPRDAAALGEGLANLVRPWGATCVLAPALGGIVIGHEVARALDLRSLFAERQEGVLTLRRGFTLAPADRVLVVEDVVTTAGSTRETIAVAERAGAQVVGACAIVDRSGGTHGLTLPFAALLPMQFPLYVESECPMCKQGLPVVKPGSRCVP
jgi:orotate phosphoribosyltransferase